MNALAALAALAALVVVLGLIVLVIYIRNRIAAPVGKNNAKLIYTPPRAPGLAGLFFQHLYLHFSANDQDPAAHRDSMSHALETARYCQSIGAKAYWLLWSVLRPRLVLLDPRDCHAVFIGDRRTGCRPAVKSSDPYVQAQLLLGKRGLVTNLDEADHLKISKSIAPAFSPKMLRQISGDTFRRHIEAAMEKLHREYTKPEAIANGSAAVIPTFVAMAMSIVVEFAFGNEDISLPVEGAQRYDEDGNLNESCAAAPAAGGGAASASSSSSNSNRSDQTEKINIAAEFDVINTLGTKGNSFASIFMPMWLRNWIVTFVPKYRDMMKSLLTALGRLRRAGLHFFFEAQQRAKDPAEDSERSVRPIDVWARSGLEIGAVADNTITLVGAGSETTSTSLGFTSYLLAHHPAVQEHLFDELQDAFALNTVPNLDDVENLPYLNAVIKESLRVLPPVVHVHRLMERDQELPSGVFVPAGTVLQLPIFLYHRDQEVYGDDADSFRPERWLGEEGVELCERVGMCSWQPFAAGSRKCIGSEFAMQELRMTVAAMCRRFVFFKTHETQAFCKRVFAVTMRPMEGTPIKLVPREE